MAVIDLYTIDGQVDGQVELDSGIFEAELNVPAMHQVVVAQLAAARRGTSKVKTRGEVAGGGRKPYRQKGTGRARQGSIRAPHFSGGGISHGPTGQQNYTKRVNKKLKKLALRSALSDRNRSDDVRVVRGLAFETPKTKDALALLEALGIAGRKVLIVLGNQDDVVRRSFRNLPTVHVLTVDQLNTYDVLCCDVVVFGENGLPHIGLGTRADSETAESAVTVQTEAAV
ncbi:MAG: 50S ribosomal protein L4 [Egibacteraceae bacterium]